MPAIPALHIDSISHIGYSHIAQQLTRPSVSNKGSKMQAQCIKRRTYRYNGITTAQATAASERIGRLSVPGKMPCHSYNLPIRACVAGAKARKVPGTVCHECYGAKGRYPRPSAMAASERRLACLQADEANGYSNWTADFVLALKYWERSGYFRWHDIGDVQNAAHLAAICEIARQCPDIRFWLPTREYRVVRDYVRAGNAIPANLNIRLSGMLINFAAPTVEGTSRGHVVTEWGKVAGLPCHAQWAKTGKCQDCRACWRPEVSDIQYHLH